jgi:hypothetical protein
MRAFLTLILIATVLVVAGCGGASGDSASIASAPLGESSTQAILITRADVICKRLNVKIASAKPKNQGIREIARLSPIHARLEQAAVAELDKLTPPSAIATSWRRIIAYRRALAEELVKLGRYAQANNVSAVRALAASKRRTHKRLLTLALRTGFKACSLVG